MPFLPKDVARAVAGHPLADKCESKTWKGNLLLLWFLNGAELLLGLYFVGVPCCRGVSSEFLRGIRMDSEYVAPVIAAQLKQHWLGFPTHQIHGCLVISSRPNRHHFHSRMTQQSAYTAGELLERIAKTGKFKPEELPYLKRHLFRKGVFQSEEVLIESALQILRHFLRSWFIRNH